MSPSSAYAIAGAGLAGAAGRGAWDIWLSGRVLAGMNVTSWDANAIIQALVRSGRTADPSRLAYPGVPWTSWPTTDLAGQVPVS